MAVWKDNLVCGDANMQVLNQSCTRESVCVLAVAAMMFTLLGVKKQMRWKPGGQLFFSGGHMCPRATALMVKAIHSIKGLLSRTVEHLMEEEQEEEQFSSLVTTNKKSSSIISTSYRMYWLWRALWEQFLRSG